MNRPRSSQKRYRLFVDDYRRGPSMTIRRKSAQGVPQGEGKEAPSQAARVPARIPALAVAAPLSRSAIVFVLALTGAGLQMVEPLFMRFIVDRVLLNRRARPAARLSALECRGLVFLALVIVSNLLNALRDYRQRLLNTRVMLSLRRSLFDRLLHLPLPKLWDMKTGGILSRLTGDVDTTTGLLQMAIVSPVALDHPPGDRRRHPADH